MENLNIGQKYYMIDENDELDMVRVHSIKNGLTISRGINKTRVDDDFLDDYTPLNPDGRLIVNVLNMGPTEDHGQDVTVILLREKDIREGNVYPYAVCRQNIHDEYSNPFNKGDGEILGMSMNRDNVPRNAKFSDMLMSHSVDYEETIYVYLNDSMDMIISMISDIRRYNRVLYDIYKVVSKSNYSGLSKSIDKLIKDTNFKYDFKTAFDVTLIDEILRVKDGRLTDESRDLLVDIFKVEMVQTYVMPYSHEVDLSSIQRSYRLVEDKIGKTYIVGFDEGVYMNTYIDKDRTVLDAMGGTLKL